MSFQPQPGYQNLPCYPSPGNLDQNSQNPQANPPPQFLKVMGGTEASWKKVLARQKDPRMVICVTAFVGLLAFCLVAFALQPIFLGAIAAMGIASGAASIATLIAIAVAIAAVVSAAAGYATHRIQEYYSSKSAKEYAAMSNPEFERIFNDTIKKEIFTELQNAARELQGKPDDPNLIENFKIKLKAFQNAFQKFCEYTHAVIMPFIPNLRVAERDLVDIRYLNYVTELAGMYTAMASNIKDRGMLGYAYCIACMSVELDKKHAQLYPAVRENLTHACDGLKKLLAAIKTRNPMEANDAIRAYNEACMEFFIAGNKKDNYLLISSGFNSSLLNLSDANIAIIVSEVNDFITYLSNSTGPIGKGLPDFIVKLSTFGIVDNAVIDSRCISPGLCKKWKGILEKINNSSTFNADRDALKEFLAAVRDEYPDAFIPEIDFTKLENDKNENLKQLAKNISSGLKNDKEFSLKNSINTTDFFHLSSMLCNFAFATNCGIINE
ncbi:MAG: hypothetical protein LBI69_00145 [Puniceicoccales bacterium]|jgi:hypothetical protein|nr:hypothetical protein [Puniceicoccales bacterium]